MLIEKELLQKALKVMKKVILDSKLYPIYDNAIFSKDNSIRMTSGRFDFEELDLEIKVSSGINNIGNTPFLLPVKMLDKLCSTSAKKVKGRVFLVDFELVEKGVKINLDGINTTMKIQHLDDYPVAPMIKPNEDAIITVVDVPKFVDRIKFVRKAISSDISREQLNHMYVAWDISKVVACCTDGYRLAKAPIDVECTNKSDIKFMMSSKFIDLLFASITAAGKKATVEFFLKERSKNKASKSDAYKYDRVYARIIGDIEIAIAGNVSEYQFPDIEQVFPDDEKCETVVKVHEVSKFINVLKRALVLSSDVGGIFKADKDGMNVVTRNLELGDFESELVASIVRLCTRTELDDDDNKVDIVSEVGANLKYMIDAICANDSSFEMLFMENGENLTPIVIYNESGCTGLVMPRRFD